MMHDIRKLSALASLSLLVPVAQAQLDPLVNDYKTRTGISEASAQQIDDMLTSVRAAGVEPAFFWIGGKNYNRLDQTAAVIGTGGAVVGANRSPVAYDNFVFFQRGKALRFDNPESLRGQRTELFAGVWYRSSDNFDTAGYPLSAYSSSAHGPSWVVNANSEPEIELYHQASGSHRVLRSLAGTLPRRLSGRRVSLSRLSEGDNLTFFHDLGIVYWHPIGGTIGSSGVFNDSPYIHIGGRNDPAISYNDRFRGYVSAVILAESMASGSHEAFTRISSAPYEANILAAQRPGFVCVGDSTMAAKWNSLFSDQAEGSYAGEWHGNVAIADEAKGGKSLDYFVGRTDIIKTRLRSSAFSPMWMIYTVEKPLEKAADNLGIPYSFDDWYDYTEEWLRDIRNETNCRIALCSYIKGNNEFSSSFGQLDAERVREICDRNGWTYIPHWEDKHSQVFDGSMPEGYGFYEDAIHQDTGGRRIQAEIVAAAMNHTGMDGPRSILGFPPAISGMPETGKSYTATVGYWYGSPENYEYQWLRNLEEIPGATSDEYLVTMSDAGARIACRVTATGMNGLKASMTSDPSELITGDIIQIIDAPSSNAPVEIIALNVDVISGAGSIIIGSDVSVTYSLQASNSMGHVDPFVEIAEIPGQVGQVSAAFVDSGAIGQPKRFYRIVRK